MATPPPNRITGDDPNDFDEPPFANPNAPPKRPATPPPAKPAKKAPKSPPMHSAENGHRKATAVAPVERQDARPPDPEAMDRMIGEAVSEAQERFYDGPPPTPPGMDALSLVRTNIEQAKETDTAIWQVTEYVAAAIESFRQTQLQAGVMLTWPQAAQMVIQALIRVVPQ